MIQPFEDYNVIHYMNRTMNYHAYTFDVEWVFYPIKKKPTCLRYLAWILDSYLLVNSCTNALLFCHLTLSDSKWPHASTVSCLSLDFSRHALQLRRERSLRYFPSSAPALSATTFLKWLSGLSELHIVTFLPFFRLALNLLTEEQNAKFIMLDFYWNSNYWYLLVIIDHSDFLTLT